MIEVFREWIEWVALAIELMAVLIMVAFIVTGTFRWLSHSTSGVDQGYKGYRMMLGKSLLVGLELLVAADIIRTVTIDTTLSGIATLGALVVVRTALSWTLTVEVEGRWPWKTEMRGERTTESGASNPDVRGLS